MRTVAVMVALAAGGCGGDAGPGFDVALMPNGAIVARPGDAVSVRVSLDTAARAADDLDLDVTVEDLPPGVTAAPLAVGLGARGTLTLTIAPTAPLAMAHAQVRARHGDLEQVAPLDLAIVDALAPGMLDPSFGFGGLVPLPDDLEADQLAIDGNGAIVATAYSLGREDLVVARYLPDGRLDPTFGDGGRLSVTSGLGSQPALGLFPRAEGDLSLVMRDGDCAIAVRLGSHGETFFQDHFTGPNGLSLGCGDVAVDERGSFVVTSFDGQVARFSPAGALDTSYGERGVASPLPLAMYQDGWSDVAVVGRDAFLVGDSPHGAVIAHVSPDGVGDVRSLGSGGQACCVAVDSRGRIVAAAYQLEATRLLDLSTTDVSFGTPWTGVQAAGLVQTRAMLVMPDDGIMLAGTTWGLEAVVLGHLDVDGRPVALGGGEAAVLPQLRWVTRLALAADGDLLLAGGANDGIPGTGVIARIVMTPR